MQKNIQTYVQQISPDGGERSTSSPVASPASRSLRPVKGKDPMTTDTFGRLCLEQFGKSVPDGSWARTFSELLIGMGGWYSSRCALTWKLKATKSNRSYFQLAASTLRTADTELSLLPTPAVMEDRRIPNEDGKRTRKIKSNLNAYTITDLLPTPIAGDWKGQLRSDGTANMLSGKVALWAKSGWQQPGKLLPTPTTMDCILPKSDKAWEREMTVTRPGISKPGNLRDVPARMPELINAPYRMNIPDIAPRIGGRTSHLNPLFVEEMMGFPSGWILLPFLRESPAQNRQSLSSDGEQNQ